MKSPPLLALPLARRIWLRAQRLDRAAPFGAGPAATPAAVAHLGYVQIDTIHVIERCHHHILHTRIPSYRRDHLQQAQSIDKSVFEYWGHALAYLPTDALRFQVRQMRQHWHDRVYGSEKITPADLRRVVSRIRKDGALTIRDIDKDVRMEKDYSWGSSKPSKRALEAAFYKGLVTISQRTGMLKSYELLTRHLDIARLPRAATRGETLVYRLDRALRSQGIVSLESVCHLDVPGRVAMQRLVHARVRRGELLPVSVGDGRDALHWVRPEELDTLPQSGEERVHILSPFDPLIIQRRRLHRFFEYEYRFEAYVPKEKRVYGYFVCPVLLGDRIVAALDLKTDRQGQQLLVQRWNWVGRRSRVQRQQIEEALHEFERFQLGK